MNKIYYILILILTLISANAFSQPATIVGSAFGEPGDTVSIPIDYLGTASGVVSFQADINFDNTNLSVAVNCNSTLGIATIICSDNGSLVRIIVLSIPSSVLPNGQIGTLDFTIAAGVTTPNTFVLTVTNEVYSDTNAIPVNPIGTTDGLITVDDLYSVGGNISGLTSSVTLQNNAGDDLVVTTDGPFTFPIELLDGSNYAVTVSSQPTAPNQVCAVTGGTNGDGTGTIAGADEISIQVLCTSFYSVGGNISGLTSSVTLQNNVGDDLVVTTDGPFTFPIELLDGSNYAVTVSSQPTSPNQICLVTGGTNGDGSGSITAANETTIQITCNTLPVVTNDSYIRLEDEFLLASDVTGTDGDPNNDGVLANDTDTDVLSIVAPGTYDPIAGIGGLLTIHADGGFFYSPPTNVFGVATFSFEVTDGISNVASTLSITVLPVNDTPTFNVLGDVNIISLAFPPNPVLQIPNFAHNIDLGEFENLQTIQQFNLSIISDTNGILNTISMGNSGDLDMNLTFNQGVAIIQLSLQDDGGVANGGVDTSDTIEFNIFNLENMYADGFEDGTLDDLLNNIVNLELKENAIHYKNHKLQLFDFNNQRFSMREIQAWMKEVDNLND